MQSIGVMGGYNPSTKGCLSSALLVQVSAGYWPTGYGCFRIYTTSHEVCIPLDHLGTGVSRGRDISHIGTGVSRKLDTSHLGTGVSKRRETSHLCTGVSRS